MKDQYAVYLCKEPKWQAALRKAQAKHDAYHAEMAKAIVINVRKHAKPIQLKYDGYSVIMEINKKPA